MRNTSTIWTGFRGRFGDVIAVAIVVTHRSGSTPSPYSLGLHYVMGHFSLHLEQSVPGIGIRGGFPKKKTTTTRELGTIDQKNWGGEYLFEFMGSVVGRRHLNMGISILDDQGKELFWH